MRAAAILGLGSSTRDLKPFQQDSPLEWVIGLPAERDGLDAILVFGGDGTVHRHLGALAKLGLPVLVVPAGSGNDFARALGLLSVQDSAVAWRKFAAGANNARLVDLGMITPLDRLEITDAVTAAAGARQPLRGQHEDRKPVYFSCAAGVGLDGEIARRANSLPRWLRAHGGYALSLPSALLAFRPFELTLSVVHGESAGFCLRTQRPVMAAVFANTPVYGGGMKIAPQARMDDGLLDVCVIREISKLKLLTVFPSVYLGKHLKIAEVEYFHTIGARVETEQPRDVYADGEFVCRTPVEIGIARTALRVIVPD